MPSLRYVARRTRGAGMTPADAASFAEPQPGGDIEDNAEESAT